MYRGRYYVHLRLADNYAHTFIHGVTPAWNTGVFFLRTLLGGRGRFWASNTCGIPDSLAASFRVTASCCSNHQKCALPVVLLHQFQSVRSISLRCRKYFQQANSWRLQRRQVLLICGTRSVRPPSNRELLIFDASFRMQCRTTPTMLSPPPLYCSPTPLSLSIHAPSCIDAQTALADSAVAGSAEYRQEQTALVFLGTIVIVNDMVPSWCISQAKTFLPETEATKQKNNTLPCTDTSHRVVVFSGRCLRRNGFCSRLW